MNRYIDSQGAPRDPALIHPPEGARGMWSPDAEADYQRRLAFAEWQMTRFAELAEATLYWQLVDAERIIREVFGNTDAADWLANYIELERARMYAQIAGETNND